MSVETVLVRLDRIGDLVVTVPVDEVLDPNMSSYWFINKGMEFILENSSPSRSYSALKKDFQWSDFWSLYGFLKKNKVKNIVIFHAPWWVSFAAFLAGTKNRIGRLSQWHSYLFLNKGIRQKRSRSEMHEMEYNLQLVESLKTVSKENIFLKLKAPQLNAPLNLGEEYYVVHPGMNGSALNWSQDRYIEIIEKLIENNKVVITGTDADRKYLDKISSHFSGHSNVIFKNEQLNLNQLLNVLSGAKCVLAPSTGIAHLAASLETPIVGLYSPIVAESSIRWKPVGPKVAVVEPQVEMAQEHANEVMDKIRVDVVFNKIKEIEK